jgi:hypothetical protein
MQMMVTSQRMAWSLPELASLLGLSLGFLRKEARRGTLRTRRIGRRLLVLEPDLRSFLDAALNERADPPTGRATSRATHVG